LSECLVRNPERNGDPCGVGFLADPEHVITRAHVVADDQHRPLKALELARRGLVLVDAATARFAPHCLAGELLDRTFHFVAAQVIDQEQPLGFPGCRLLDTHRLDAE
jgi:hypothetical protein